MEPHAYGLKQRILSPTETVAQSLSSIAPTAGPTVLITLVYALSGAGTWLVFLIALCGMVLVAMNINTFARRSASPGSLYQYVASAMGAAAGVTAGWVLTYRNVQLSARTMLWFEVLSVALISILLAVTLARAGFHPDRRQLHLEGVSPEKLRLGLVLETFAFVGFESSTALGDEVKNPLRAIPRAVIAICAVVSFFACMPACMTAAARILFMIGRHGLLPASFGRAHVRNRTPHHAVGLSAALTLLPAAFLAMRGVGGMDINAWTGTFATYGFVTAYVLVCVAAPLSLRRRDEMRARDLVLAVAAIAFMIVTLLGNIYPRPPAPYSWMPFAYAGCLVAGPLWQAWRTRFGPGSYESSR